jgi:hypothetical protein
MAMFGCPMGNVNVLGCLKSDVYVCVLDGQCQCLGA